MNSSSTSSSGATSSSQIKRRHPGRQSSTQTADILNQSISKLREQQRDMEHVNVLSDEVSNLNSSVNDIREALTDVVMHLKYGGSSSGATTTSSALPAVKRGSGSSNGSNGSFKSPPLLGQRSYDQREWISNEEDEFILPIEEEEEEEMNREMQNSPNQGPISHTPSNTPNVNRKSVNKRNSASNSLFSPVDKSVPIETSLPAINSNNSMNSDGAGLNIIRSKINSS